MKSFTIVVIDGQGGKIGKQLVEAVRARLPEAEIAAVGTNSIATSTMMKAGATRCGTGENAVLVACRTADVIVGPLGIVIADSMMGEISPAMAAAIGQSAAVRLLIPMNLCNNVVVGVNALPIKDLIPLAADEVLRLSAQG